MPNRLSQMGNKNGSPGFILNLKRGVNNASESILGDLQEVTGVGSIGCPNLTGADMSYYMGLAGMNDDEYLRYLGNKKKRDERKEKRQEKKQVKKQKRVLNKQERKNKRQAIFDKMKKGGFLIPRGSFLVLMESGRLVEKTPLKINLAKKMADLWLTDGGNTLKTMWSKFGGDPTKLRSAIIKGSTVQLKGMGVATTAIVTTLSTALPIVIAAFTELKNKGQISKGDADMFENTINTLEDEYYSEDGDSEIDPTPETNVKVQEMVKAGEGKGSSVIVNAGEGKGPSNSNSSGGGGSSIVNAGQGKGGGGSSTNNNSGGGNVDEDDDTNDRDDDENVQGSFLSPLGMCFKGIMLSSVIQQQISNPILLFILSLIVSYLAIGFFLTPFYYGLFGMKPRFQGYFEKPAAAFYSLTSLFTFKKRSDGKI